MGKLTALDVRHAKPGKYGDGRGLMLVVSMSGAKKWVLRIQARGKRHDVGLGSATYVSLSEARTKAEDKRRAFRDGRNPIYERRRQPDVVPTFRQAALMVHEEHRPSWKNPKHAAQWLSSLEAYAFPKLGALLVDQIDGPMVRDVLAEIWLTIPETARRVRQRIGTVLDSAYAKGWREAEAPMKSVTKGLPKQPKSQQHFPAMPWQEVPDFVASMGEKLAAGETVRLALEFIILTASRSGEARGARWDEFNLETGVWTLPAERMKGRREHRVPLSAPALDILGRMAKLRRTDSPDALVFEGANPGRPLSDMTLTMPLRRAGIGVTVHGFRSAFRDWAGETTNTPREVAEACLAHVVRDRTEAAYARTDHLDKRRAVMEAWGVFVTNTGGKVLPMVRVIPKES